jgi:hypothetical protein
LTESNRFALVPLAEISKRLGVPGDKLYAALATNRILRLVPRSFDAKGKVKIYRVDFESALIDAEKKKEKEIKLFDDYFSNLTNDITLD